MRVRSINAVAVAGAVLLGVVLSGTYLGYWNPPLLSVDDEAASGVPPAVLCLILGAMSWVMQRKEPNLLIGLRTRWTLRSNLSWVRSHRFAGQSSPVAAAVLIVPELLGVRLPGLILFGLFLAWLVLLWYYSYVQWRDDPDRIA
ncbi:MAG: SdpI family protein [Chromatiales bacterium]|nr:SdpI family protein [Chromatiales bacterium]